MRSKKIAALLLLLAVLISGCSKKDTDVKYVEVVDAKSVIDVKVTTEEDKNSEEEVKPIETPKAEVKPTEAPKKEEVKKEEVKKDEVKQEVKVEVPKTTAPTQTQTPAATKPAAATPAPTTQPSQPPTPAPKTFAKPGIFSFETSKPSGVSLGTAKLSEAQGFTAEQVTILNDALDLNKADYDLFTSKKSFEGMSSITSVSNKASKASFKARQILVDTKILTPEVKAYCNEFMYVSVVFGETAWEIALSEGCSTYKAWTGLNNENSTMFIEVSPGYDENYRTFDYLRQGKKVTWQ
jgi:hypothetical protein